jgi:hypothetical protein
MPATNAYSSLTAWTSSTVRLSLTANFGLTSIAASFSFAAFCEQKGAVAHCKFPIADGVCRRHLSSNSPEFFLAKLSRFLLLNSFQRALLIFQCLALQFLFFILRAQNPPCKLILQGRRQRPRPTSICFCSAVTYPSLCTTTVLIENETAGITRHKREGFTTETETGHRLDRIEMQPIQHPPLRHI